MTGLRTRGIPATVDEVEVVHAATSYRLTRVDMPGGVILVVHTSTTHTNAGQWLSRDTEYALDSISWDYLTEKLPALRDGDFDGWVLAFAQLGIEVF